MYKFSTEILKYIKNFKLPELFSPENVKNRKLTISKYYFTLKLYLKSVFKEKLSTNIHLVLLGFYSLFILIYFIVPSYSEPVSNIIKSLINTILLHSGFEGFSDTTVKYIISTTTNLLVTVLTILSAMYVFTHREQKTISPSLYNESKKNTLVIGVVIVLIFTMITGHTLSSNIDSIIQQSNYSNIHSLYATKLLFYKILIWAFGIFLALLLVIELIRYLFISMNADRMLKDSISLVSEYLDILLNFYRAKKFNALLNQRYKFMHHNIESIFQYLKFLGDNNMNKDFDENINNLSKVIEKLKKPNAKYDVENVSSYLLEQDKDLFLEIYNSLLRNTLSLTLHLYKNNHFNKGKKLTDLYFSIFLHGEDNLKQHFTLSLNEFLDSLDTSNERQVKHFLSGLKNLPEDSTLIIYKNLMQKLIIKGNLGLLTTVVYDFKEHMLEEKNLSTIPKPLFKAIAAQNQITMKKNAIIILLQLLVKAIEISQYSTAGFLVKYMVTNFNGDDINDGYQSLRQNPISFTSIMESTNDHQLKNQDSEIGLVVLNSKTFDYCCKKMKILLYGQHQFAIKEKLWFTLENDKFNNPIEIEKEFDNCPYSNYVMKKVQNASSKFGILFFDDKQIMSDIYKKLNIEHHYLQEEKQLSISKS